MIVPESRSKDLMRLFVWTAGAQVLSHGPPGWEVAAVRGLGRASRHLLRRKRAQIERNIRRAFPIDGRAHRWTTEAFEAHLVNQYASFSFRKCTPTSMGAYLEFQGLERLDLALETGGVVLAQAHMGPAQLPLHLLGHLGYPTHQVAGGHAPALSRIGSWAAHRRSAFERRMPVTLHDGRGNLRSVVRALRRREVVITALDGTGTGEELGRRVPAIVCGHRMGVPIGPPRLAQLGNAALMTLQVMRNPCTGPPWIARIRGPFSVGAQPDPAADWAGETLTDMLTTDPGGWHFWDAFEPGGLLWADS